MRSRMCRALQPIREQRKSQRKDSGQGDPKDDDPPIRRGVLKAAMAMDVAMNDFFETEKLAFNPTEQVWAEPHSKFCELNCTWKH